MQPHDQNFSRAEKQGDKKNVYFAHRILGFYFFPHGSMFLLMVLHDVIFNVTARI
jgi:hypothetical protein